MTSRYWRAGKQHTLLEVYFSFKKVGQTRFHKSSQFELLRGEIPYLSEADRPGTGGYPLSWATSDKYPSIYPRRGSKELPGWIAFDKQVRNCFANIKSFIFKKN